MTMALIGAGIGAGTGAAAYGMGVGKDTHTYQGYQYDPNASTLQDTTLGQKWGQMGAEGQKREGVHLDNALGNETRNAGMDALSMMRDAALGNRPSVAQLQMKQGMDDAIKTQQALAASARGPQALGMAQYQQGANTAAIQQGVNAQTGQLRAQEMAQALGQYGQQGLGMRSQDEQRAFQQAQLLAQQRQMNDAYQLGLIGQQNQGNIAQMNAQLQGQGINAQSANAAQALNAGVNQANAANEWKYYDQALSGINGAMGGGGKGMGGLGAGKLPV